MTAVHPDWHLASWAHGPSGATFLSVLLADPRLELRLLRLATRGRDLSAVSALDGDTRLVVEWFNREAPVVIFRRLGILRHAAIWGDDLVMNRGKGVPNWVTLDDIKRGLTVLQRLPGAAQMRGRDPAQTPEALVADGQALVAGWWASLVPDQAADLAFVCPSALSVDLPDPALPAKLCAQAVHALAMGDGGAGRVADLGPDLADAVQDGGFDD